MPESELAPGTFYAFADSPDRQELLHRYADDPDMQQWTGNADTHDGACKPIDLFVPSRTDASTSCMLLTVELDLQSIGPMDVIG